MERASNETGLRDPHRIERWNHVTTQDHGTRAAAREPRPGGDYCPTPEEIAAECRRIQGEWSDRERWRRAGFSEGRPVWEVPMHHLTSLSPT